MRDSAKHESESSAIVQLRNFAEDISAFVHNATEEQREALLRLLNDGKVLEFLAPWRRKDRRGDFRKPCFLTVQFAVGQRVLAEIIKNASVAGVLMHTFAPLRVGQEISMTIWPTNVQEPVEAKGKIVWTGKEGVGVRFEAPPSEAFKKMIESL